jgi:superfamily II DNA helicase RecQ
MAFKFFTVPVGDSEASEAELNAFLRGHRVLSVERRLIESGSNSFWAFCVDYVEAGGDTAGSGPVARGGGGRVRVDYREALPPEEFAVFARLRQWRKEVAQREAVPVYTVFTNDQLARMVRGRAASRADLEAIAGVGDARIDKYGPQVLDLLKTAWGCDGASGGPAV